MTMTDAPEHDVKRAVARRMIARERLASYEPLIQELVHERIDTFVHRGEVEFCSELANPLAFHMICRILGIPKEEVEIYWSRGQPGTGHGFRFLSEEQQAELLARPDPESYMREQVLRRYEHPGGDDFLSEFVAAHVERADGELQLDYLTTESELLLRAGNETTARLLASTMRLLLENPAELDRVVADRSLAKAAIEETLRLEAPTQWVTRRCTQDTDVGGVRIPAGALVVVLYASGNRDEEKWGDDVDAFRLDRTDVVKHQLAFGTGAHLCLGAPIARLEARIALEIILERLRNIRFAPGHGEVENIDHIQKRAPKALYLEFDPA
jgi:cytochrome P450